MRPQSTPIGEKGPVARRRPKAAGEAYSLYVERAAEGANEADGPLSSLSEDRPRAARRVQRQGGARRLHAKRTPCAAERAAEGANEADGPLSSLSEDRP